MAQASSLVAGVLPPFVPKQEPRPNSTSTSMAVAVGVTVGVAVGVTVVAVVATTAAPSLRSNTRHRVVVHSLHHGQQVGHSHLQSTNQQRVACEVR